MISVVITFYNSEQFVQECMEHVVNQTIGIENIEVVALDNASTDSTLQKLKVWKEKYPDNIKILHKKENSSKAGCKNRNLGVEAASGDYILFLDHDDHYEPEAFEVLDGLVKDHPDLDYIEYAFNYTDIDGNVFYEKRLPVSDLHTYSIRTEDERIAYAQKNILPGATFIWTKIYKKSFLTENQIQENCGDQSTKFEDSFFTGFCSLYCETIGQYDKALYNYRNYIGSDSHAARQNDETQYDRCKVAILFHNECIRRGLMEKQSVMIEYLFARAFWMKTFWRFLFLFDPIPYEKLRFIQSYIHKEYPHIKENPIMKNIPWFQELFHLLDEPWTDEFIDQVYAQKKQEYDEKGTSFDIFLGQ